MPRTVDVEQMYERRPLGYFESNSRTISFVPLLLGAPTLVISNGIELGSLFSAENLQYVWNKQHRTKVTTDELVAYALSIGTGTKVYLG